MDWNTVESSENRGLEKDKDQGLQGQSDGGTAYALPFMSLTVDALPESMAPELSIPSQCAVV